MNTTNASEQSTTKKGYWVIAYRSISDESALKAYRPLAVAAVQSFGGRFLTGSTSQIQAHEAGLPMRTTLVEFDSYAIAVAEASVRNQLAQARIAVSPDRSVDDSL
jgi:uncharacterized protein (DUF1330 family)